MGNLKGSISRGPSAKKKYYQNRAHRNLDLKMLELKQWSEKTKTHFLNPQF